MEGEYSEEVGGKQKAGSRNCKETGNRKQVRAPGDEALNPEAVTCFLFPVPSFPVSCSLCPVPCFLLSPRALARVELHDHRFADGERGVGAGGEGDDAAGTGVVRVALEVAGESNGRLARRSATLGAGACRGGE